MNLEFSGELWYWRGPAPYHFVTVPDGESAALRSTASAVSYGWGMIPVRARIGGTEWTTSLWPKNGRYVVPVKDAVRSAEELDAGDAVTVHLTVDGCTRKPSSAAITRIRCESRRSPAPR